MARDDLRLMRSPRWWIGALTWAAAFVVVVVPSLARAGKFDRTLEFSLHARGARAPSASIRLRSVAGTSGVLEQVRLAGPSGSIAPLLRANLALHGFRFGVGAGFEGYNGLRLDHDPLPSAYSVRNGRVWGIPVEGFVGYALRSGERIRPYAEARTSVTVIGGQARLRHLDDGDLGRVRFRTHVLTVAAHAGVLVALNDYFFLHGGVGRAVYGGKAWTASVGIGIPIPLSNL